MDEAKAADEIAVFVQPLDTVDGVDGLGQGEDAAREGQADELHRSQAFAAVRVAFLRQGAAFHTADAARDVEGADEGAGGVLFLRNVRDDAAGVQMRAETASRGDDGDAGFRHLVDGVLDEDRALGDDVHIHGFVEADGHRFHFLHGHTAVGEEAFVHGNGVLEGAVHRFLTAADRAAAGETEFAGGEVDNVEEVGDHSRDLADALVLHGFLAGLDEVEVVLKQGGVENGDDAVLLGDFGGFLHVLIGHRLTADEVGAGFQAHEGNVVDAFLGNAFLQTFNVDISLERQVAVGFKAFILHELFHVAALSGDVSLRGGEVVVHDDAAARLDEALGEDVLAGAALMRGGDPFHAEDLFQLVAHAVERLGAGIGIVGAEHCGLHVVAHGVDAGVGEHIHEDIAVMQLECVESRLVHLLQTLIHGQQVQLLDDLDFVKLHRDRVVFVKLDFGHVRGNLSVIKNLCQS